MDCDPVGFEEVAELLGVSKQRVHQLMQSYDDFPTPVAELAMGRVWSRADIETWQAGHPRRPGRPAGGKTVGDTDANVPLPSNEAT
jgi:prophage regulatory protein